MNLLDLKQKIFNLKKIAKIKKKKLVYLFQIQKKKVKMNFILRQ